MIKSAFSILAVAAVAGIALTPVAASAATAGPAALAYSSSPDAIVQTPTTVTFAVTTGLLTITAPGAVDLGDVAPGGTASGTMTAVVVTDDRAALNSVWAVTASMTDLTTGAASPAETIPASNTTYDPGTITNTGTVTVGPASAPPIALGLGAVPVVVGTGVIGDNTATWTPTIAITIPAAAVTGPYTGTLSQSVS